VNLVLLGETEVAPDGAAILGGDRARHLREVLNVARADTVRIGIIDGPIGVGTVSTVDHATVTLQCTFGDVPPRPRVDLMLAVPRPKVLRRLWAQLAALGVGRIILTNAARVERNYFDTHVLTPECYRPLLIEGLQQARDTRVPQVTIHRRFRVLIEDELGGMVGSAKRLVADPRAGNSVTMRQESGDSGQGAGAQRLLLAVGPEGGWNDFELALLESHHFRRVSMGPRTLRTDTACIALLGAITSICEL
jgi:16S rRNA (uracil1498-N3)-methyltransferase